MRLVVRNSATRRYFSLLFLESLYYFYLNMGLFFQGKRPKKGEIFRDPELIAFFSFAHSNEGECEWRNQHRPSKGTWIRPVQSRTSSMILTNDYQRTINLVREGPMTTPTQTKGQRSSLGLPVTSTPFSDLKAGCCQNRARQHSLTDCTAISQGLLLHLSLPLSTYALRQY